MKKLHLVSLGCPKNLVDSEVMLGILERDGYTIEEDPAAADILLINTCGFIQPAVEEAVDEILRLAEYKEEDPRKILAVTGCLVQRYGSEMQAEFPEVDLFIGADGFQNIDVLLRRAISEKQPLFDLRAPEFLMSSATPRKPSTPFFRAYLKITEGCDNRCAYCMIPSIRGSLRSRSIKDLVDEAVKLESSGVRELTLIAQDLTAYGDDLQDGSNLPKLLREILNSVSIPWLRLLYLYPSSISDELLELMANQPRIMPYLDIPFQHVSNEILKRMNRRYGRRELDELIDLIRSYLPECCIRTSLMVGFPGETDEHAREMIECLEKWRLDHVGVFQYADEEGSPAFLFTDKVAEEIKEERYKLVMETQAVISTEKLTSFSGKMEPILLEGVSEESELLLQGRTRFQAPDIDGCVYITDGTANPGDIVEARITETHTYDLIGEIAGIITRHDEA